MVRTNRRANHKRRIFTALSIVEQSEILRGVTSVSGQMLQKAGSFMYDKDGTAWLCRNLMNHVWDRMFKINLHLINS